jgi:hypothetical protein
MHNEATGQWGHEKGAPYGIHPYCTLDCCSLGRRGDGATGGIRALSLRAVALCFKQLAERGSKCSAGCRLRLAQVGMSHMPSEISDHCWK